MTAQEQKTKVWQEAAKDLGFRFIPGFTLKVGADSLKYLALVPDFGGGRGMLIIVENGEARDVRIRAAAEQGFGFSCLSEHCEPYDRSVFIDLLNDWGWVGAEESRPGWCVG